MTAPEVRSAPDQPRRSVPAVRVFGPSKVMTKFVLAASIVVTAVEAATGSSGAAVLGGLTAVCALGWYLFRFPRLVLTEEELIVRETPFLENGWAWEDLSPITLASPPGFSLSDRVARALGGRPVFYFLLSDNRSTASQSRHLALPLPRFVGYGKRRADPCREEVEAWRKRYGRRETKDAATENKKAVAMQTMDKGIWSFVLIHLVFWSIFMGLLIYLTFR